MNPESEFITGIFDKVISYVWMVEYHDDEGNTNRIIVPGYNLDDALLRVSVSNRFKKDICGENFLKNSKVCFMCNKEKSECENHKYCLNNTYNYLLLKFMISEGRAEIFNLSELSYLS